MDLVAALAADLAALNSGLEEPDLSLESLLQGLIADLERAVTSYLGLRLTLSQKGYELSFTVRTDDQAQAQIAASFALPLSAAADAQAGGTLVLYAATPGAFVDLAADLSFALGLDLSAGLDQHLSSPAGGDGVDGLRPWSDINQAVGVLIAGGHTPESAHTELRRLANLDSGNVHHAAAAVLAGARKPTTEESE